MNSALLIFGLIFSSVNFLTMTETKFQYPKVRRDDAVVDDYFGTKITDPYRWLEDANSSETKAFVESQNNTANEYLARSPFNSKIRETLTQLWTYPKEGLPFKRGDNYFVFKNSGLQNQRVLYKGDTLDSLFTEKASEFLNPNDLSSHGIISLGYGTNQFFSKDGALVAYSLSKAGSDWVEIHVRNVSSGQNYPEVLRFIKFAKIRWTHGNLGFFYSRFPEPKEEGSLLENQKIFFHKIDTEQDRDILVAEFPHEPKWFMDFDLTDNGEYLLIQPHVVREQKQLFYTKVSSVFEGEQKNETKVIPLVTKPASYSFVASDGPILYWLTNSDALNYKLIAMDINNPGEVYWATVLPEDKTRRLRIAVPIAKEKLITSYLQDVKPTLELRNLRNGTLIREYVLDPGALKDYEGRREDFVFYIKLSTFYNPGVSYKLDFENGSSDSAPELQVFRRTEFHGLDTSLVETTQVFYESKDGVKIPMFITKRKGLTPTAETPTLLYGYGAHGSILDPYFSPGFLAFITIFDGVLATPNIRGGGEYGTWWWDAGRLLNKQNSFDDFAYAAKYLIRNNYTNPSKLSIQGSSSGGLLVAASINQHPELYGAAIVDVGIMDLLRLHKFTIGAVACVEFGCSDNQTQFENLIKYSPINNVKKDTKYPAVLVSTAEHDDRASPFHSYKFISQLQYSGRDNEHQTNPLLIRVEKNAGHGHGKPTWMQINQYVDYLSFIQQALRLKVC